MKINEQTPEMLTKISANLMFTLMNHTTHLKVKSLLIEHAQKLKKISGCVELEKKYGQKQAFINYQQKNPII